MLMNLDSLKIFGKSEETTSFCCFLLRNFIEKNFVHKSLVVISYCKRLLMQYLLLQGRTMGFTGRQRNATLPFRWYVSSLAYKSF